jgi:hypothetical protein
MERADQHPSGHVGAYNIANLGEDDFEHVLEVVLETFLH